MKKIFVLSEDNLALAKEEVIVLTNNKDVEELNNLFIVDTEERFLHNKLAFTHKILKLLFKCKKDEVKKETENFDWAKIYEESFRVHVMNGDCPSSELANIIWDKLKNPKADMKYARTTIEFYFVGDEVVCGVLEKMVNKDYLKRKAHMLPEPHPTAMSPKLAKALVNISGIETGESLLDPFCGAGGILIEAGIMRFKTFGWDIDQIMVNRAKINLEHFKVKRFHVELRDALEITDKFDIVVTDLPYGRNSTTAGKKIEDLYKDFLEKYYDFINRGMVVVFPDFFDYSDLIKKIGKWKISKEFDHYLHKSLSRKIVVLEK